MFLRVDFECKWSYFHFSVDTTIHFFTFSFSKLCQNSFSSFLCRFSRSASGTGVGGSICEARGEFRSVGSQTFYLFLAFHIFISSLKAISSKLYLFLFRYWIVPFHSFYSFLQFHERTFLFSKLGLVRTGSQSFRSDKKIGRTLEFAKRRIVLHHLPFRHGSFAQCAARCCPPDRPKVDQANKNSRLG